MSESDLHSDISSAVDMTMPTDDNATSSIRANIKTIRSEHGKSCRPRPRISSCRIYDEKERRLRQKQTHLTDMNVTDRTPGPQRFTRIIKPDQTIFTPMNDLWRLGRMYKEAMDEDSGYSSPMSFPGRPCTVGREKMDIIGALYKHEQKLVDRVLVEFDIKDVVRFSGVCANWRQIVQANAVVSKRKRCYLLLHQTKWKLNKENNQKESPRRTTVSTSTPLREVQPIGHPQASSTPTVEHRNHDRFIKASESLLADESFIKCVKPACRSPARLLMNNQRAKCTHCHYDFCTNCLSAFHASSTCSTLEPKNSARQPIGVGSAKSKRSLRRICRLESYP